MARYRQADHERYIEADNGFGWVRKRGSSALSVLPGIYQLDLLGIEYKLEKFEDFWAEKGWYLYSLQKPAHFWGEFCAVNLLPAIDRASELIAKADLRGEGYEKEEA